MRTKNLNKNLNKNLKKNLKNEEVKNEEVKPEQKPQAKEESKQQTSVAQDTSDTKQLPETGIAGVLEILGLGAVVSALGAASYLKKKK